MKIAFVIRSLANGGGIERTLTDKANYLAEQGHQVIFVTYEQGQHEPFFPINPSVSHTDLDCRRFTLYRQPLWKRVVNLWMMDRRFRRRWLRYVDEHRPDVVVVTTYSDDFMSEVMAARHKTRIIVESHTAFAYDKLSTKTFVRKWRQKQLLHAIGQCHLLIALSDGDVTFWQRYVRQVQKLPNAVGFYPSDISDAQRDEQSILSVGRLDRPKRFDLLIDAFSMIADKYPQWHVDIYGDGLLRQQIEQQVTRQGLDGRVVIHRPTPNIIERYLNSGFFVLCSDYEGFGLVLAEAMSCGLPVVSVNCPYGPAEVVEDGITGLLTQNNAIDIAQKMEWMIAHPQERLQMGKRARQAAARFQPQVVMKQWEAAYCSARP